MSAVGDAKVAKILRIPAGADRSGLNWLITYARQYWPWRVPVYQALLTGELAIVTPEPDEALPDLSRVPIPVMVVLSEHNRVATGPVAWAHAVSIIAWGRPNVLVHRDCGSEWEYREAIDRTQEVGRFVVVETTEDWFGAWQEVATAMPLPAGAP